MSQIYQKPQSKPASEYNAIETTHKSSPSFDAEADAARVLQDTKAFVKDRDTLVSVINQSDNLLSRLREFGQDHWMLAYPNDSVKSNISQTGLSNIGPHLRRIASEFDGNGNVTRPSCHPRSATTIESVHDVQPSGVLNILAVDHPSLPGRRTSGAIKDIESSLLMRQSLASMLCSRLESVQSHLGDLRTRVMDQNSRILVTGDLNAGKSTFVNALLGREVAPTDQQPCTEVMCEILDMSHNSSKEEIHAIPHGMTYNMEDTSTYDIFEIERLSELVSQANDEDEDEQSSPYQLLKVYIAPQTAIQKQSEDSPRTDAISLLRNGNISVSFIDSPGLNRDTLSTMELFSKQSTIDVVVFVVSAENQFTLSAQEFLWAASQEKAYVFVVVNKWGGIKDKVKAERRIREQLRKLSPGTWEERTELVHFVDSQDAIISTQPAQTYTRHLLQDLSVISQINVEAAQKLYEEGNNRLRSALPRYEQLLATSSVLEDSVCKIEEDTVISVHRSGKQILTSAIQQIKLGELPIFPETLGLPKPYFPVYDGLLTIFQYAEDVRKAFLAALEDSVMVAEDVARGCTAKAVETIRHDPATTDILSQDDTKVRTFNPKAMFSRRRRFGLSRSAASNGDNAEARQLQEFAAATKSLGVAGFGDLIDFDRLNWFGGRTEDLSKVEEESALTHGSWIGSVGLGTLTLFGTGVTGGRAFVETMVKVSEILGSKGARKWTGAAIGIMTVAFGVYLIADIPRAIPHNIGRKLERELNELVSSCPDAPTSWVESEVERLTKETRKVVRLAGWDLRQRFRSALEEAGVETDGAKAEVQKAIEALAWLEGFGEEVGSLRSLVDGDDAVKLAEWKR
ncbi:uncharacterized protein MELLADRAFT_85522 [Melampsora larici-populina 98AG31]|uniref:Dynamin-type G domain-containing protein n=1 Tax=Melampsora larici-populina (strain 98AG31 / pathotype 3-4-7) TaxID=747676 RepID=F4RJ07_MELLP|nr:uncharacterized protein MELLADRAFT_85522 [Melampsora larici-populina 98AG31]EGG07652.1 hypothetical protein MELLADRAFT_85522 [Melampsora larici-populina 98AG31]